MLAGLYLSHRRVQSVFITEPKLLKTPYDIELHVRYGMHLALYKHITEKLDLSWTEVASVDASGKAIDGGGKQAAVLATGSEQDVQNSRYLQAQSCIPGTTIELFERTYKDAVARFKQSALICIFAARSYAIFGNKHLQMV
jgi:hypothetical protein